MNASAVAILFRKELIDLLRDRRTLVSLVLVPMLVGPVMMTVMNLYVKRNQRQAKVERYKVGLRENVSIPGLRSALAAAGLAVVNSETPRADVESNAVTFGIEITSDAERPKVRFYSDNSEMAANMARSRVSEAIDKVWRERLRNELARRNIPESVLQPFERESVNVAPPRRMTGAFVGRLLGFLMLIFLFNGAMFAAVDMTAGEKERRTLEILLASAAGRVEIVTAKVLMALLTSFGTTVLSLSSYAFAFAQFERGGSSGMAFPTDPFTVALLAMLILPVAVVAASISVAAATPAKSTREAMSYLTPGLFIVMFLGMTTFVTDNKATPAISVVPFANFAQMLRDVLSGEWSWEHYALTLASNLAYSALAIAWAVRSFTSEKILFRS